MRKTTTKERVLRDKFLASLPTQKNDNKPFITIYMLGLPGVGKSRISKIIAEKLGIYVFTIDKVRRLLNDNGYRGNNPDQDLVEYISNSASHYMLNNGISYIMDADAIRFIYTLKRASKKAGSKFILIRVVCSEKEALNRIRLREKSKNSENYSKANEKTYFIRKKLHEHMPRKIFYTFDSEADIEPQIDEFISLI